jgi:hypothetical protein
MFPKTCKIIALCKNKLSSDEYARVNQLSGGEFIGES